VENLNTIYKTPAIFENSSAVVYNWINKIELTATSFKNLLQTWIKRSNDRRALALLSPRLLNDIGLTEHDVMKEIARPFWK